MKLYKNVIKNTKKDKKNEEIESKNIEEQSVKKLKKKIPGNGLSLIHI